MLPERAEMKRDGPRKREHFAIKGRRGWISGLGGRKGNIGGRSLWK